MIKTRYDLLCIGNAIVDVIAHAEETFLRRFGVAKGSMTLIDAHLAETLYAAMGPATIVSGGSAANTAVGAGSLGGRAAYIGKIRQDSVGDIFAHDIRASGVSFDTQRAEDGPPTARSFILVTPDGERTMCTYLGACQNLTEADIDQATVKAASITYLEGYLWDPPAAKAAFRKAAAIAHSVGRDVALTLSDSFCVDRYRDEFLDLIRSGTVDLLFANEHELKSLYQTADFNTALSAVRAQARRAVVTRSAKGALAVAGSETAEVAACPIDNLVDTTGAGDLFAAGFLFGSTAGYKPEACLRLGALAASHVIQTLGARPQVSLRQLAIDNGLI
ncbi:MAG TPA: adenosine kinase [Beijerinckiaceae bacterium]|nr:adenosine kinase [Beijerinckiaceae bacterium]